MTKDTTITVERNKQQVTRTCSPTVLLQKHRKFRPSLQFAVSSRLQCKLKCMKLIYG